GRVENLQDRDRRAKPDGLGLGVEQRADRVRGPPGELSQLHDRVIELVAASLGEQLTFLLSSFPTGGSTAGLAAAPLLSRQAMLRLFSGHSVGFSGRSGRVPSVAHTAWRARVGDGLRLAWSAVGGPDDGCGARVQIT